MNYEQLKEWIAQSDFSQAEIAKMIGKQQGNFCGMVNGYPTRNITIRQLERICSIVGHKPRYLFPK